MIVLARVLRDYFSEPAGGNISPFGWTLIACGIGLAVFAAAIGIGRDVINIFGG